MNNSPSHPWPAISCTSLRLTICGKVLRAEQSDPVFGLLPLFAIALEEILVVSGMVPVEDVDVAELDCVRSCEGASEGHLPRWSL
jgi:hypothetical protein